MSSATESARNKTLHGILPVLHTPLLESGEIDVTTLRREVDWALRTGADGVVVAMVSEVLRLGYRRRRELAAEVVRAVDHRGFTVLSVGAESIDEAIELAEHAEGLGATAIMAIPPVSTSLDSQAKVMYYSAIASSVSIPLVVQDASSYVGAPIDLWVYLQLLDQFGPTRIFFKPEASPLGPNLSKLRDATNGDARIFEGSGGINLVDCFRRGIVGTMPGTDLLDGIVALWTALKAGDEQRIYDLSLPISALVALQLQAGLDGFLAIEKYLLKRRGIFPNTLQVPPVGWKLDAETRAEVDRLFARMRAALE